MLVAPVEARPLVEVLGERLGEAVGERLGHDRAVVVVLGLEAGGELVRAVDRRRRTRRGVAGGRDVVREAAVRARVAVVGLLAQAREARPVLEHDVVAVGVRGPEAVDAARGEQLVADDLVEQLLRVVVELARGGLLEDRGELALQLPRVEEELPVDVVDELRDARLDGRAPR